MRECFNDLDGFLLFCIRPRKTRISSIFSTCDYYNRGDLFSYKEFDEGLNRLISNKYVEQIDDCYKLTKSGKELNKKLLKERKREESSIYHKFDKIEKIRMEIIPDYQNNIINEKDYKNEIEKYYMNWNEYNKK